MMSTRRLLTGLFLILLFRVEVMAQTDNYNAWFAEAYQKYPNIPQGVLESVAWSASRLNNIHPSTPADGDEVTMPLRFGIFSLIEDGKGYFKNNLLTVTALSGITAEQFKNDVRLQILAVAKFLSKEAEQQYPTLQILKI